MSEQNSQKILLFWCSTILYQSSLFALAWSIAGSIQEKPYYTKLYSTHFKPSAMVIWLCWGWDQSKLFCRTQIINFDFTDKASSLLGSLMNDGPHPWTLTLRIAPYVVAQGWFTSFIWGLLEWRKRMVRWLVIYQKGFVYCNLQAHGCGISVYWVSWWNRMWSLIFTWLEETSATVQALRNIHFNVTSISCDSYLLGLFVVVLCWPPFYPWKCNAKLESSLVEKDLEVQDISKVSRSQQDAFAAKWHLHPEMHRYREKCLQ